MGDTSIQWTDKTWNPTRGCSRVSPGCEHCYAEQIAYRFAGDKRTTSVGTRTGHQPFTGFAKIVNGHPAWTGKVELIESKLTEPLHWKKPQRIFVNSMSDLFHEALPDEAIDRVFAVMALCPQHTFQVLTKRAERMLCYMESRRASSRFWKAACLAGWTFDFRSPLDGKEYSLLPFPLPNVWLGVSVEDQQRADERIPLLLQTPAAVRFVSYEPALGPVNFLAVPDRWKGKGTGIDWIICGGESGPGARRFDLEWMRSAVVQCKAAGTAIFCKQIGSNPYWAGYPLGRAAVGDSKGGDMETWPEWARIRQFPTCTSARAGLVPGGLEVGSEPEVRSR